MMTEFYEKARNLWQKVQDAQIMKGLKKYPEPFNPHNWTAEELLNHALEESVDLTHYLVGLKEQLDAKDKEIAELRSLLFSSKPQPKQSIFAPYFDQDDQ